MSISYPFWGVRGSKKSKTVIHFNELAAVNFRHFFAAPFICALFALGDSRWGRGGTSLGISWGKPGKKIDLISIETAAAFEGMKFCSRIYVAQTAAILFLDCCDLVCQTFLQRLSPEINFASLVDVQKKRIKSMKLFT